MYSVSPLRYSLTSPLWLPLGSLQRWTLQGTASSPLSVPFKIRSPQIEFDVEKATQLQRHAGPGIPTPQCWGDAGAFRQPKPYPRLTAWGWRRASAAHQSRLGLNKQVNRTVQRLVPNRLQTPRMITPRPRIANFQAVCCAFTQDLNSL